MKPTVGIKKTTAGLDSWQKKATWFLSGQAVSLFGSGITQYAIIWYITLSTSSGMMITISTICAFLPQILISLFAGVWADRHDRKFLIMASDGMIAVSTLILAIIFMTGYQELWLLFAASAIRSVGAGIQTPSVNAVIPQIVPEDKLMRMNGINGTIQSLTMLVAPAVSGVVLSIFGLEAAFFLDVITAAIALAIMSFIKIPRLESSQMNNELGALDDMKAGVKYTWGHPFLRSFLGFYAVLMFLITPAAMLTPLLTARSFGEEVWKLTANEMSWSFGMMLGGLVISLWGGFKKQIHTFTLGTIIFGLFTAAMGLSGNFVGYLVMIFLSGLSMPLMNSTGMVMLQKNVEMGMQGRVFSFMQIISASAIPFGMIIFGPLADMIKIEWLLVATGILIVVLGLCIYKNRNIRSCI